MKTQTVLAAMLVPLGAVGFAALDAVSPVRADTSAQQAAVAEQVVTLRVGNMTCAMCPITVKKAMAGVPGVRSVEVDFEAKTARVVFDQSVTSPADIAAASTNAGYPAEPTS
ncbi:MAG: heavy metal-associated domain-containing protein [Woeseia sp.]